MRRAPFIGAALTPHGLFNCSKSSHQGSPPLSCGCSNGHVLGIWEKVSSTNPFKFKKKRQRPQRKARDRIQTQNLKRVWQKCAPQAHGGKRILPDASNVYSGNDTFVFKFSNYCKIEEDALTCPQVSSVGELSPFLSPLSFWPAPARQQIETKNKQTLKYAQ